MLSPHAGYGHRRMLFSAAIGLVIGVVLLAASAAARAADRVYWGNFSSSNTLSFANLDGSGAGGDLNTTGSTPQNIAGLALDPAANKIYWGTAGFSIGFANLDGDGAGGDFNPGGLPVSSAQSVAVDPGAGRIYWGNSFRSPGIYFANANGTGGGGQLNTDGATVDDPIGVAVDPAAGRIYWANPTPANKISFANLNGSGGGDINTTGATVVNPQGVAVDPAAGRIYWANVYGTKISFARLDGSGGGDLNTTGATIANPVGVSIDSAGGKIYWGNAVSTKVSFARLDNSGGGDLNTSGATTNGPVYPVVLKAPSAAGAPAIVRAGRTLDCSTGEWAADLVPSFLYRAPSSFSFQWSQDSVEIPGVTAGAFTPAVAGHYRCAVTGSNPAGSATQSSAPFAFFAIGKAHRNSRRGTAMLPVTVPDPGALTLTGTGTRRPVVKRLLPGTTKLVIRARGRKQRKLSRTGQVKLGLSLSYAPDGLAPSSETTGIRLRKR